MANPTQGVRASKTPRQVSRPLRASRGFTLIELLVVIALIAMGTAAVSFSLRDSAQTSLVRDGERLAALFESARARSRTSGMPVIWHSLPQGTATSQSDTASAPAAFVFEGLAPHTLPEQWLSAQTQAPANTRLVLGPDPVIGPQSVMLRAKDFQIWVSTDGLKPFTVLRAAP